MPKFVSPSGRQYTQRSVLGTGTFGTIIVCKDSEHENDCIMKRVRLARQTPQERFASVQELAMMQQLRHSNLIGGIDGWVLAAALSYLHSVDILHRDIKSSNIFIADRQQLKLGDLGLCRQLSDPEERPKTSAGTLNYMSPELTNEESYSKPADIWALGCVFFEVCALKPAFYSFNIDGITKKIKSGKVPAIPAEFSEPLRRVVRAMLYTDESKRPTAEEILAMPFLQDAKSRVEQIFGAILTTDEFASGPAYRQQDVPREWRTLMKKFHAEHKEQEATDSRRKSSSQHSATPAAAGGKTKKPRGGWRVPAEEKEHDTSMSGSSSADTCHGSTAAATGTGDAIFRAMNTRSVRTTDSTAAGMDVAQAATSTNALHSFAGDVHEALTRLQPSDGDELIQAAAASVRASSKHGAPQHAELPGASSITSELLEAAGNRLKPQTSCGGSDAQARSNSSSVQGRSTSGVSTSSQKAGATGPAAPRSPAAVAANAATGAEYLRTSDRIRSVNNNLRGRMAQESAASVVDATRSKANAVPLDSASICAPGALKNTPKPARLSSARTALHRTRVQQAADTAVKGSCMKFSDRSPARHT